MKLLQENVRKLLLGITAGDNFLDKTLKIQETETELNKQDSVKLRNSCSIKNHKQNEESSNRMQKIIIIYLPGRRWKNEKTKLQVQFDTWAKNLNRYVSKKKKPQVAKKIQEALLNITS